jgi:hypothetical protein
MTHVQFSPGASRTQKASPISITSALSVQESHRPEFQLDGNAIDLHRGARCEQALSIAADEPGHVEAHAAAVHLEDEGAPNHPLDFSDELDPSLIRAGDHERRRRFDRGRESAALCGGRRGCRHDRALSRRGRRLGRRRRYLTRRCGRRRRRR